MRAFPKTIVVVSSLLALSACGKSEMKTGSLVQRFTMVNDEGRNFGVVEFDPVNGGTIIDAQGRIIGRIVPPAPTNMAAVAAPMMQ